MDQEKAMANIFKPRKFSIPLQRQSKRYLNSLTIFLTYYILTHR